MHERNSSTIALPAVSARDTLTAILRDGPQRMLAQAIEVEAAEWIDGHAHLADEAGHRQVARNGRLPKRTITTGVGPENRIQTTSEHEQGARRSFVNARRNSCVLLWRHVCWWQHELSRCNQSFFKSALTQHLSHAQRRPR